MNVHSADHKVLAAILALALVACGRDPRVRAGSKNFTEQLVLGEIIAQHPEHKLGGRVSRKLDLGGTLLAHPALVNGDIDVLPEYTGTALTAILNQKIAAQCACQSILGWLFRAIDYEDLDRTFFSPKCEPECVSENGKDRWAGSISRPLVRR